MSQWGTDSRVSDTGGSMDSKGKSSSVFPDGRPVWNCLRLSWGIQSVRCATQHPQTDPLYRSVSFGNCMEVLLKKKPNGGGKLHWRLSVPRHPTGQGTMLHHQLEPVAFLKSCCFLNFSLPLLSSHWQLNLKKDRRKKKYAASPPSPLPSQPPSHIRGDETGCLSEMAVRFVLYSPEQVSSASQTVRLSSTKRAGAAVPMASAALHSSPQPLPGCCGQHWPIQAFYI